MKRAARRIATGRGLGLATSCGIGFVVLLFLLQTAGAATVLNNWQGASSYRGTTLQAGSGSASINAQPTATVGNGVVTASSFDVSASASGTVGSASATSYVLASMYGNSALLSGTTPYYFSVDISHNLWAGVMSASVTCGTTANATASAFYILGVSVNDTTTHTNVASGQAVIGPPLVDPTNQTPLPGIPWFMVNPAPGPAASCWSLGTFGWGIDGVSIQTLTGDGNLTVGPTAPIAHGDNLVISVHLIAVAWVQIVNAGSGATTSASASVMIYNSGVQPSYTLIKSVSYW
jgi:hypothetical protein